MIKDLLFEQKNELDVVIDSVAKNETEDARDILTGSVTSYKGTKSILKKTHYYHSSTFREKFLGEDISAQIFKSLKELASEESTSEL